jgi:EKC/KEOPS complex subunit CGI121/TPRKB
MAHIHTLRLPHFPNTPIHLALYESVTNTAYLRSQLLSANPAFDYAFLDATMILSARHLLLATTLALHSYLQNTMKTRTPHSELVFRLHPNNNIGESYRKFGISDTTECMIAVKFGIAEGVTEESVGKHLGEVVEGTPIAVGGECEELEMFADEAKIKKIYKLNDGGKGKGKKGAVNGNGVSSDEREQLESVILGTISLKGS